MKTDYLDLWQCHQVMEQKEVDQILGPKGSLEAFVQAKKEGKVRHIGFTGHRDPAVHKRMIESCTEWETVQMPINLHRPALPELHHGDHPAGAQAKHGHLGDEVECDGRDHKEQRREDR